MALEKKNWRRVHMERLSNKYTMQFRKKKEKIFIKKNTKPRISMESGRLISDAMMSIQETDVGR